MTKVRFGKEIALILTAFSLFLYFPYVWDHAQIGHRGEGTIILKNVPKHAIIQLDGYLQENPIYHVLEGPHTVNIIDYPHKYNRQVMIQPYSTVTITYQSE